MCIQLLDICKDSRSRVIAKIGNVSPGNGYTNAQLAYIGFFEMVTS